MKPRLRPQRAFTLMEVIIAMAIFFVAMFSILQLMSRGLSMARSLQQDTPSPGMIAAELSQLAATNRLEDGWSDSGDFERFAPDLYPNFRWTAQTFQFASNGLYQADIAVVGSLNGRPFEQTISVFLFSPRSAIGGTPGLNQPPPGGVLPP
jgi:prepilin-type N-terminal cleavage/methylation domain-containing protein